MTVQELIELLESADPEAEVRLASQPHWPLAHRVGGVAIPPPVDETALIYCGICEELCEIADGEAHHLVRDHDDHHEPDIDDSMDQPEAALPAGIVWIVEGGHPEDSPYASKALWDLAEGGR